MKNHHNHSPVATQFSVLSQTEVKVLAPPVANLLFHTANQTTGKQHDKSEMLDRHSGDEFYSDEDDWDQDPPASKPETVDSFLDYADWRQLIAASRQHLALADQIDMSYLQELTRGCLYGPAKFSKIAPSAFWYFVQERRPTLTGTEIQVADQLRTGWSSLSTHEKRAFEKKSKEMQEQYDREASQ